MNQYLSERALQIKPSPTLAANDKAKKLKAAGNDIINLTAGQSDFQTPEFIKEAGIQAIKDNHNCYTPVDGIPELKTAIINKLKRDNQLDYNDDQIIVSSGVKQCLFNLTQAVLQAGDEAIVLAPYWVSYSSMITLAGATPIVIQADIEQKYKISPQQLEDAITPRTKLLFINSPSNPAGAVYSREELQALGEVLIKYPQVLIVSDDIYEYILWGQDKFYNIVNTTPELYDRTVVMNGVAKAHCMTGWRIGFAACHPTLRNAMKKIQSQSTTCATSIAQHAAVAAFNAAAEDFFPPMLEAYKQRHDWVIAALNKLPKISAIPADGTFYAFFDARELIKSLQLQDDIALTDYFLEEVNIAMVPGSAFGSPGYMRLSFATSMEQLKSAFDRLKNKLEGLKI